MWAKLGGGLDDKEWGHTEGQCDLTTNGPYLTTMQAVTHTN